MKIVITSPAQKDMRKLGAVDRERIINKLTVYAASPKALANQVKRLKGDPVLRLRVGDYRVLFSEDGIVLHVLQIGHRREIYR